MSKESLTLKLTDEQAEQLVTALEEGSCKFEILKKNLKRSLFLNLMSHLRLYLFLMMAMMMRFMKMEKGFTIGLLLKSILPSINIPNLI